jgi:hypothetical protein
MQTRPEGSHRCSGRQDVIHITHPNTNTRPGTGSVQQHMHAEAGIRQLSCHNGAAKGWQQQAPTPGTKQTHNTGLIIR